MTLGRNRRSGVGHRAKVEAVKHEEEAGEEPTPKIFKFYIFPSMHFGQENKMFLSPPVENVVKHVLKEMLKIKSSPSAENTINSFMEVTQIYDAMPSLKAHSHEVHLTHAASADGCIAKEKGFFQFFAQQLSTTAACINRSSCESS